MDLRGLARQSDKANEVIAWKTFSWTDLFNVLEEVLPNDVRLTSVRPMFRVADEGVDAGTRIRTVPVAVEGIARTYGDLAKFQLAMQDNPHFGRIEPLTARRSDNREYKYQMRFQYIPAPVEEPAEVEVEVAEDGGGDAAASQPDGAATPGEIVVEEVAPDGFTGAVAEEQGQERPATEDVKRRIERPRRAGTEQKP